MPIYSYHCDDCKEDFELFIRSLTAKIETICPKCGSEHVVKAVAAVSAIGMGNSSGLTSSASSCAPSG